MLKLLNYFFTKEGDDQSFFFQKSALAFMLRAGGMFTQYLFVFVTAHLLGPKALGTFTLSYTVVQLITIFALMGLDSMIVKTIATNRSNNDFNSVKSDYLQSIRITAFTSIGWGIIMFITAPWLAQTIFSKPELTTQLRVISASLPAFVFITINSAAFRGYKNMSGFLAFRASIPLMSAGIVILTFYSNHPYSPVTAFTFSTIIIAIASFIGWRKYSRLEGAEESSNYDTRSFIKEALPMMFTGSIFFILGWTDNVILGIFRSEAEVGIYDTAFKIAGASEIILIAVSAIQAPSFAEFFHKGEHKELQHSVFVSTRLLFWTTLPITVIFLIFPEVILSVFGKEFIYAATALRILAIGNFVNCITGSVGFLLQMTGYQKQYNRIITIAAILGVIINFILIPSIGLLGAAISTALAKIILNVASAAYVKHKMGIRCLYLPGMKEIQTFSRQ